MNAVDTNILVYSLDVNEPAKKAKKAQALLASLAGPSTILPWQVVGEFLNWLRVGEMRSLRESTVNVSRW